MALPNNVHRMPHSVLLCSLTASPESLAANLRVRFVQSDPRSRLCVPYSSKHSAIVQLLSSMLQYKNNLDMANINAQTNLAVVDKYNAMSKYMSELNAATNLQTAGMSAAASRDVAGINASASRHASDVHLQAQQYASDIQSYTSKVVASINAEASDRNSACASKATQYAASLNAAAQRYATDQNNATRTALQEAQQKFQDYLKNAYPSNVWSAAVSVGRSLGEKLRPEWQQSGFGRD